MAKSQINVDVRPSAIESAYVEKPFDEAKAELEKAGYHVISLEEFANLRISQGKGSHIANYGSYSREGFLYAPKKGRFLVRNSPIMSNAQEATECHRNGKEFYLTGEQVEQALSESVEFKDSKAIPTERFGDDERTLFAFGKTAGKYGEFLSEAGISEMPVSLADVGKKPFARQAWLLRSDEGYGSGLYGNYRYLGYYSAVRGVRNVEPRSGEDAPQVSVPTLTEIVRYSQKFVPEVARTDFEEGLSALFKKQ